MTRLVWQRLNGRSLVIIGVACLLGAASEAALAILSDSLFPWSIGGVLLVMIGVSALMEAPKIEAAHLVEQARQLIEAGQFREAIQRLNRAIELRPRFVAAYLARSAAYTGISQLDLAVEDAERAVKIAPKLPETRLTRARLYSHRGLHEDAIRDLRVGIREKPDWAAGYLELAQLHIRLHDYDSSLATLRDLSLYTSSDATRYDSLIMAGWVYEDKLKDLDGAIATYTRAIPIMPDRKIGYLRRAYAYRTRGDLYQAAEDLLRAAQRLPTPEDAGQYHWLRAVCYGRRYTITGEERDLLAWMAALERSVREDGRDYAEQSRQWLQALRDKQQARYTQRDMISGPPAPRIFPN